MKKPLIAVAIVLAAFVARDVQADDPVAVTSDSFAYCHDLARRLPLAPPSRETRRGPDARLATPASKSDAAEIERLRREGTSMCEAGRIRSGIIRLRRALMMERGITPSPG